jgi:hypothetical protein
MTDRPRPPSQPKPPPGQTRDARLKAALRANLARRKAQARVKAQDKTGGTGTAQGQRDGE